MRLHNILKSVILFSVFCSLYTANAQSPNKMSYQAVVRNASNALVTNNNVGIQISILQTTATGSAVYIERHTTPTNVNGLATIEIGGGTVVSGTFANINWANGPFFIKTETDPTGGTNYTISGTSQLLSVPFALFAASSGGNSNAWGINGNNATATNFIGTTNDTDVFFKRDGVLAGRIGNGNSGSGLSLGTNALSTNPGTDNTAIGSNTIQNNVTGSFNVALGSVALRNNISGSSNVAVGTATLRDNTTGNFNVAVGEFSLLKNTTASDNTAIGSSALHNNTTGDDNSAIGREALFSNTTGSFNTGIGKNVLFDNTTGSLNVAIGINAMENNTSGNANTATGGFALSRNTIGIENSAFGSSALESNTTGNDNTASGRNSLRLNSTGNGNTATGKDALSRNSTASNNTANGKEALRDNTTGSNNTSTGFQSLLVNTTGINNTANGVLALDSNTTGNDNTAMGRSALTDNIIGVSNTAIGKDALFNSLGNNNTALGRGTLSGVTTGSNNTAIGFDAQVPSASNSNQLRLGNTAVTLVSSQVALTVTSDSRWKSNIQKSNLGLDFIKQLNPVFYTRKDVEVSEGKTTISENTTNPITEYGFIAQELEETLNKFDAKNNGIITKGDDGMYGVRYNDLIAPMVKAMQEQQAIIEAQAKTINEMLKRVEAIESKK